MSNFCFEFTKVLNQSQADYELDQLITGVENRLKPLPVSGFHNIIGKDLLHLTSIIRNYLEDFYDNANQFYYDSMNKGSVIQSFTNNFKPGPIKAIKCEMNNFTMSTDKWFMDAFSYSCPPCGESDPFDWFTHFDFFTLESLTFTGYEELQKIYSYFNKYNIELYNKLELASKYCETLIILRFQEVVLKAIESIRRISRIPYFVTVFNNDMVLRTFVQKGNSNLKLINNERGVNVRAPGIYSFFS